MPKHKHTQVMDELRAFTAKYGRSLQLSDAGEGDRCFPTPSEALLWDEHLARLSQLAQEARPLFAEDCVCSWCRSGKCLPAARHHHC